MMELFNQTSYKCSKVITQQYSTSFTLGIKTLDKRMHDGIYGIYGFVRLADEIVDTFHDYDKLVLLENFEREVNAAIDNRISLNPVLQSFQLTFHKYAIGRDLVHAFLKSMRQDL